MEERMPMPVPHPNERRVVKGQRDNDGDDVRRAIQGDLLSLLRSRSMGVKHPLRPVPLGLVDVKLWFLVLARFNGLTEPYCL